MHFAPVRFLRRVRKKIGWKSFFFLFLKSPFGEGERVRDREGALTSSLYANLVPPLFSPPLWVSHDKKGTLKRNGS